MQVFKNSTNVIKSALCYYENFKIALHEIMKETYAEKILFPTKKHAMKRIFISDSKVDIYISGTNVDNQNLLYWSFQNSK